MASVSPINGKNGVYYRVVVTDGFNDDGSQYRRVDKYYPEPGMTQAEIRRELNIFKNEFELKVKRQHDEERKKGVPKNKGKQSLFDYGQWFLSTAERKSLIKIGTIENYQDYLTGHMREALGNKAIGSITTQEIEDFLDTLRQGGIRKTGYAIPKIPLYPRMKAAGLTQKSLGDKSGLHPDTVALVTPHDINKPLDKQHIAVNSAQKIADVLGKSINELFEIVLDKRPLGDKTVLENYNVLCKLFGYAHDKGHISSNPMTAVDKPFYERAKVEAWEYSDLVKLANALRALPQSKLRWKLFILLLIATAARREDMCGLMWQHIDFDANVIIIEQGIKYKSGRGIYLGATKESDYRVIKLSDELMDELKSYRDLYLEMRKSYITPRGDLWRIATTPKKNRLAQSFPPHKQMMHPDTIEFESQQEREIYIRQYLANDFLFVQIGGFPGHPDSVNTWLAVFCQQNGLPHLNPHKIRHTIATELFNRPEHDIKSISILLGHASTNVTESVYVDRRKAAHARASIALVNPMAL